MKPIEINKEDVDIWFEEQAYEDMAENTLHNFVAMLRYDQQEFLEGKRETSGVMELMSAYRDRVIGAKMYLKLFPLITNPDLEYTIVHKKDETSTN